MKIWAIAWKDTLIRFRDRNALILMLAAPLIISAIMGAAFGGGDDPTTLSAIPLILVNQDSGPAGAQFGDVLKSGELATLLSVRQMDDVDLARQQVEEGQARAVVHIPAGFSAALSASNGTDALTETAQIAVFTDPAARITPAIITTIVNQIGVSFGNAALARQFAWSLAGGAAVPPATLAPVIDGEISRVVGRSSISVDQTVIGQATEVNPLGFFAPSMAIFFLLFTMFDGPRSILTEQMQGTFDRLRSTPTGIGSILMGKLAGTFLIGILQFSIFVLASSLLFGLSWGNSPLGLAIMVVSFVAAAAGIGALITAFSRDIVQANLIGSSLVLLFGFLGGNFFGTSGLPEWLQIASRVTINRWGIDGFTDMTIRGLGLNDILLEAGVLLGIALVCFFLAAWRLPRRFAR